VAQSNVLKTLRAAERGAQSKLVAVRRELRGIRAAIVAVAGSLSQSSRGRRRRAGGPGRRRRRTFTAAQRREVAARMRAYWKKRKAAGK
jgi:hypothetical protein